MLNHLSLVSRTCLLGLLLLAATPFSVVQAEELVTDISEHLVAIRSNFTGKKLLLFGAVEAESKEIMALDRDVVIVIRGPGEAITSRRKARVAGIWMNFGSQTFDNVPGYYAVMSTRPLEEIASREVLERHEIGAKYLRFATSEALQFSAEESQSFRESILRLMAKQSLYTEVIGGVSFLGKSLFRASVELPANVPVGNYTADVFLIRDGSVIHAQATPLFVNKIGIERFVFNLAHRQPLIYGLVAVALALIAGWLAAAAFRK